MFEQYSNRVEGLLNEVRIAVSELKDDVAAVKGDTKDLRHDIADVKKDTKKSEEHLKHINGSVKAYELKIHDMERDRSADYRAIGCPQNEIIRELANSMMSAAVLREYLEAQAKERDRTFGLWLAIASVSLAAITLTAMFYIG